MMRKQLQGVALSLVLVVLVVAAFVVLTMGKNMPRDRIAQEAAAPDQIVPAPAGSSPMHSTTDAVSERPAMAGPRSLTACQSTPADEGDTRSLAVRLPES